MARVGVYWQEHQNTSAESSGTHTAHCGRPNRSQELKPGPLQYNYSHRETATHKVITKCPFVVQTAIITEKINFIKKIIHLIALAALLNFSLCCIIWKKTLGAP